MRLYCKFPHAIVVSSPPPPPTSLVTSEALPSCAFSNHFMIRSEAKGALEAIQARSQQDNKAGSFQNVLERLLRLRQMYV